MKKLRNLALALILVISTTLLACGKTPSPSDIVSENLNKLQNADISEFELLTLTGGTEDIMSKDTAKIFIEKFKGISYKINSENIDGDTATVNVTVKGLDFDLVLENVLNESIDYVFEQAFSGIEMSDDEINAYLDGLILKHLATVTYSNRTDDLTLTKVNDTWELLDDDALAILILGIDGSEF